MDVKQYYKKIREVEASLEEAYPLIISVETSDGGKAGTVCEVPRHTAARMIVENRAVLASAKEKEAYKQQQVVAKKAAEKAELARRVQVAIISDPDLQAAVQAKKSNEPGNGR